MNLLKRLLFGARTGDRIVDQVTKVLGQAPSEAMITAIDKVATSLPVDLLGPRLAKHRPRIVLAFARQSIDGAERLKSSYWSSGGGENVGHEVLRANQRALKATQEALGAVRRKDRWLENILVAIEDLIEVQRKSPGDDDGYGAGTLHELRREIGSLHQH